MDVSQLSNGCVVWSGKSLLDESKDILLILTGLEKPSHNSKTGAVVQSYILLKDIRPLDASLTGQDFPICGDCELKNRVCYVQLDKGVYQVWKKWDQGGYPPINDSILYAMKKRNKVLRAGSYGDPLAVPLQVWEPLFENTKTWLAYTHQWMQPQFQDWRKYAMASVETISQARQASDMGWRYYRIASERGDMLLPNEMICPNKTDYLVTCEFCGLCNGLGYPKAKNIIIQIHGLKFKKRNFEKIKEKIIMETKEHFQVYLYLPVQEGLRPKQVRVIDNPDNPGYLVQSYEEELQIWMPHKKWDVLESAILSALLHYPLPDPTYLSAFSLHGLSRIGIAHFLAYPEGVDNPRELKCQLRVTHNSFLDIKTLILSLPNCRVDEHCSDAIKVLLENGLTLRVDFVRDAQWVEKEPAKDEQISEWFKNFLIQMKLCFENPGSPTN